MYPKKIACFFFKFCANLTEDHIIIDSCGSVCKIACPICNIKRALSGTPNEITGQLGFSLGNFKTHYDTHKMDSANNQSDNGHCSSDLSTDGDVFMRAHSEQLGNLFEYIFNFHV